MAAKLEPDALESTLLRDFLPHLPHIFSLLISKASFSPRSFSFFLRLLSFNISNCPFFSSPSLFSCSHVSLGLSSSSHLPGILRWFHPTERTLCSCEQKTLPWPSPGTMPSRLALPAFYHEWRRRWRPCSLAWRSNIWAGLQSRYALIQTYTVHTAKPALNYFAFFMFCWWFPFFFFFFFLVYLKLLCPFSGKK